MKLDTLRCALSRFRADENGATAVEYAMIAAGLSIAIAGAVTGVGSNLKANFYDKLAALL